MGYRYDESSTCYNTTSEALADVPIPLPNDAALGEPCATFTGNVCARDLLGATGWKVIMVNDQYWYNWNPGDIIDTGFFETCAIEGPTYALGGTVEGWAEGLTLQNNSDTPVTIAGNGPFVLATALPDGTAFNVHVATQPTGYACEVTDGVGMVTGEDVDFISVVCEIEGETDTTFDLPSGPETAIVVAACTLFALGWIAGRG